VEYGTVMIAKLKPGKIDDLISWVERWEEERRVPGFVGESILLGDDGSTVVVPVRFESRDAYDRLGQDPTQDEWYQKIAADCLEGEVRWIDGSWHYGVERWAS
jgi:hypothetical protein